MKMKQLLMLLLSTFIVLNSHLPAAAASLEEKMYAPLSGPTCVDFADLTVGTVYNYGDVFVSRRVGVGVNHYFDPYRKPHKGIVQVGPGGMTTGTPHELAIKLASVTFDLPAPLTSGLTLQYYVVPGGPLNIRINGQFLNFGEMTDIHGLWIGGVNVQVFGTPEQGTLYLNGTVNDLLIGGQKLAVNDLCF